MTLYRALLRLYPASFRAEYGDEMCAIFVASRLRRLPQQQRHAGLIQALLQDQPTG
jgi:hypothetical protein